MLGWAARGPHRSTDLHKVGNVFEEFLLSMELFATGCPRDAQAFERSTLSSIEPVAGAREVAPGCIPSNCDRSLVNRCWMNATEAHLRSQPRQAPTAGGVCCPTPATP